MAVGEANWTVITGSTGGIGGEIVKLIAARGGNLILVARSETKASAQCRAILTEHPNIQAEVVTADLMDISQIVKAAEAIKGLPGRVDVLYNNAGVLTAEKVLSVQGYESHFAINTLASYLFIKHLKSKMARPASETPAMIVNFSSSAISPLKSLDLENLANPPKVGGLMSTYAQSKLAVTALAPGLAEQLKSDNILIRAIDPGATKSPMTTGGNAAMPFIIKWLAPLLFSAADKQAAKVVDSADPSAFEGQTGIYVANRKKRKLPAPAADRQIQQKLVEYLDSLVAKSQ